MKTKVALSTVFLLKAEYIIQLDPETRLGGLEAVQLVFLPVLVEHNIELIAGFQYPAQPALKAEVPGIRVVLQKIRE